MQRELIASGEQIVARFSRLQTRRDVARLLEVPLDTLVWHLYRYPEHRRYRSFLVKKADGSSRKIDAPNSTIKLLQRKLLTVLTMVYKPSRSVAGFVACRGIRENAEVHRSKNWCLNVDVSNFFPSINFGRVRGMLLAKPYGIGEQAATTIAQLACWEGVLPQGSPCSPILANMVCGRLDSHLMKLARSYRCDYSRYADDLTFSTNRKTFPDALANNVFDGERIVCTVGAALQSVVKSNGFELKPEKSRLRGYWQRQEVTGVVVNERLAVTREYSRSLRAALHCWERSGEKVAAEEWREKYDLRRTERGREHVSFRQFVGGRLSHAEHINGRADPVVARMRAAYDHLTDAPSHLEAICVVETLTSQGTAFWLADVGLITCAHVISGAGEVEVRNGRAGSKWQTALVAWADDDADLALLLAKPSTRRALQPSKGVVAVGRRVRVVGYPSADERHSHYESTGAVLQIKTHFGHPIVLVDADIVAGVSGGPVLDEHGLVVGMARSGERLSGADEAQEKGVVLVETIRRIAASKRLD